MRDLLRVWARVEALPVAAGIDAQWKELLGDDFRFLETYLRPEQQLATTYPCPHPTHDNCPRRVVHHGPDDIVAVCGNASPHCEPLKLSRQDLVIRSLKENEWVSAVVEGLRRANDLETLGLHTPPGVAAVGTLARRGRRLAVFWLRHEADDVENLARGIRATTSGQDLVLILPPNLRGVGDRALAGGGIVLLAAPSGDDGRLDLHRALDLLDPSYRQGRVGNALAIFDDVRIELAEEPGVRHVVRLNGLDYGGFQKSDLKFLRLLLLAAKRRLDPDVDGGGWLEKFKLQGDDKDHDLEAVRDELRRFDHPSLSGEDRGALVKKAPGRTGSVRLAVPPSNITFDCSLAAFQLIGEQQSRSKTDDKRPSPGRKTRADNFARRDQVARKLLDDARKLGVPGPKPAGRGE